MVQIEVVMNNHLEWMARYPHRVKIMHSYEEPSKWLRLQFGNDYYTLSSGKVLTLNRKEGIWAFERYDSTCSIFRFASEEHSTWFILRWMTN